MSQLQAPCLLDEAHGVEGFDSGELALDQWLLRRARANQMAGASRTYVVCEGTRVVAYYALASGAVLPLDAVGRFRRNMPDPIPVAVLARLAVDCAWQRQGLGRALVRDALMRVAQAASLIGIRGIVVQAIDETAKAFYIAVGFEPSPSDPLLLMVTLADLRAALQ